MFSDPTCLLLDFFQQIDTFSKGRFTRSELAGFLHPYLDEEEEDDPYELADSVISKFIQPRRLQIDIKERNTLFSPSKNSLASPDVEVSDFLSFFEAFQKYSKIGACSISRLESNDTRRHLRFLSW